MLLQSPVFLLLDWYKLTTSRKHTGLWSTELGASMSAFLGGPQALIGTNIRILPTQRASSKSSYLFSIVNFISNKPYYFLPFFQTLIDGGSLV